MHKKLKERLEDYFSLKNFPTHDEVFSLADNASSVLENEPKVYRPWSKGGQPGGLIDFSNYKKNLPLIIVPDIHGRTYFLKNILDFVPPEGFLFPELTGKTVFEALEIKSVRIV